MISRMLGSCPGCMHPRVLYSGVFVCINPFCGTNVLKIERKNYNMLGQLLNFDADRLCTDELIALSSFGKAMQHEYAENGMEVPEKVASAVKAIKHEIDGRQSDSRDKRRRELKAQLSGLESAEDKRKRIEEELARLGSE